MKSGMEIPIFEENEKVGTLRISPAGLYTLFAARVPPTLGTDTTAGPADTALSRLWLLNKSGNAAALGLLEPCESGRVLSRKLTRLECSRLPSAPVKALILPNGEKPAIPPKEEELQKSELWIPHSEFSWCRLPDGSLIDPKRRLLALPWAGEKLPRGTRRIRKNGMEYWVFRY